MSIQDLLIYLIASRCIGTPFNDSLTAEQQTIKALAVQQRKTIFYTGVGVGRRTRHLPALLKIHIIIFTKENFTLEKCWQVSVHVRSHGAAGRACREMFML